MSQFPTRSGSSKDVVTRRLSANQTEIDLVFKKRVSIYDVGPLPYLIEEMDRLRFSIAVKVFEALQAADIPTHYRSHNQAHNSITVAPFNIYEKNVHTDSARGRIIPLEIIDRRVVTKTMMERAEADYEFRIKMLVLLDGPLVEGARLKRPLIECTTKYEVMDRRLSDAEAISLSKLGEQSYTELCEFVRNASDVVSDLFARAGFDRIDGKWEIAITYDGPSFVIVDSYSPDEMRLIGQDGRSYDKDPLRIYYRQHHPKWIIKLEAAKRQWPLRFEKGKDMWPPYPKKLPPAEVIDDFVQRYRAVEQAVMAL